MGCLTFGHLPPNCLAHERPTLPLAHLGLLGALGLDGLLLLRECLPLLDCLALAPRGWEGAMGIWMVSTSLCTGCGGVARTHLGTKVGRYTGLGGSGSDSSSSLPLSSSESVSYSLSSPAGGTAATPGLRKTAAECLPAGASSSDSSSLLEAVPRGCAPH